MSLLIAALYTVAVILTVNSHPVSNYVDRQPVPPYERENVGYRTHLSSVAPELSRYSNPRIHESDQPLERDDGVIVLTRRH